MPDGGRLLLDSQVWALDDSKKALPQQSGIPLDTVSTTCGLR